MQISKVSAELVFGKIDVIGFLQDSPPRLEVKACMNVG
jgi:hypothetical protein